MDLESPSRGSKTTSRAARSERRKVGCRGGEQIAGNLLAGIVCAGLWLGHLDPAGAARNLELKSHKVFDGGVAILSYRVVPR